MARPKKENLDYYPKDISHLSNRKIRRLLKYYGAEGYLIYEYLLVLIFGGKGYYIVVDNNLAFDISDFLNNGISEQTVTQLIYSCIEYDLFNREKFDDYRILTSFNIQKIYLQAWRGKKQIKPELVILETKTPINATKTIVFETQTPEIKNETPKNRVEMPQKKRKEKKIKESKKGYKENPPITTDEKSLILEKKLDDTKRKNDVKNTGEKKEKSSAKKEKEIFEKCKKNYLSQVESYYWTSSDDFHLRELLKKLQFTIEQGKFKTTLEKTFSNFLQHLPPFWRNKRFSINNLNLNFNEILNEIRRKSNGNNQQQAGITKKNGKYTSSEISDYAMGFVENLKSNKKRNKGI